jgi:cobalt transporter subunit CbtA
MIFSRIIYTAILIGIVTGMLLSCLQVVSLNPIISTAETYEVEASASEGHDHSDHLHGQAGAAWVPGDGLERTVYSLLANISASIGFAAIVLALMCLFHLQRNRNMSWAQGSLWGLSGFAVLFVAPAFGLPPEIPGMVTAPVEYRQAWWVLTVLCVAIGLGIVAFTPARIKALGIVFLSIPYLIGAPRSEDPVFLHPDPAVVSALVELHQQFILASGVTNLVFWMLLGLACRYAFNRWLRKAYPSG